MKKPRSQDTKTRRKGKLPFASTAAFAHGCAALLLVMLLVGAVFGQYARSPYGRDSGWKLLWEHLGDSTAALREDVSNLQDSMANSYASINNHSDSLGMAFDSLEMLGDSMRYQREWLFSNSERISDQGDSLAALYDTAAAHEPRIANLEDSIAAHEPRIADVEDTTAAHEQRIADVEDTTASHNERLAQTEYRTSRNTVIPDSSHWLHFAKDATPADAGTNFINITTGPGILESMVFNVARDTASTFGQADSAVSLMKITMVIDGDTVIDGVAIQDLYGTAESCETSEGMLFGKTVLVFDSADCNVKYLWYDHIFRSWQSSIQVILQPRGSGLAAYDKPFVWMTASAHLTAEYASKYAYQFVYSKKTFGRCGAQELLAWTTDSTGTGDNAGWIEVLAYMLYSDGTSKYPQGFGKGNFSTASGDHLLESCAPMYSMRAKPLVTTLKQAAHHGDTLVKVNDDVTGWTFHRGNNEVCAIFEHPYNSTYLFNGGTGSSTGWVFNGADSTLRFAPADSLREDFEAGANIYIFGYDSVTYDPWTYSLNQGVEEFYRYAGYYVGTITNPHANWVKGGTRTGATRKNWGLAGVATEPVSWWVAPPYKMSVWTTDSEPDGMYWYLCQQSYWASYWYNEWRFGAHIYHGGAAAPDPLLPTDSFTSEVDTLFLMHAFQDRGTKIEENDTTDGTWWHFIQLEEDEDLVVGGVSETAAEMTCFTDLNSAWWRSQIPICHFSVARNEIAGFDPFAVDSMFLDFTVTLKGSTDSLYWVCNHPVDGDTVWHTEGEGLVRWFPTLGPWGQVTANDSLPVAKVAMSAITVNQLISLKVDDRMCRYLFRYYPDTGYHITLELRDRSQFDEAITTPTRGTATKISSFDNATYGGARIRVYWKKKL